MNKTQVRIWRVQCDVAECSELSRQLNCPNQSRAQGDRSRLKLAPTDVDLSQQQRVTQHRKDPLSRLLKHIAKFLVLHRPGPLSHRDLAHTHHPADDRAT